MIRVSRILLVVLTAVLALAFTSVGAAALSFEPIGNDGHTNADPVVIQYGDPSGIVSANCMLDGIGPPTSCATSSVSLEGLSEGEHTLLVNAVVLVAGPCASWAPPPFETTCTSWVMLPTYPSNSVSFTVDRTAPVVGFTSGPEDGSTITSSSATFGITTDEGTVSCALDTVAVPCDSTVELTGLADGEHRLLVSALDQAGNDGFAARTFTVAAAPLVEDPTPGGPAATAKLLSAPKSAKAGKKIKLKLLCPGGCTLLAVTKVGSSKAVRRSIKLRAGTTVLNYKTASRQAKKIKQALKKRKAVTIGFSIDGGKAKKVKIRR